MNLLRVFRAIPTLVIAMVGAVGSIPSAANAFSIFLNADAELQSNAAALAAFQRAADEWASHISDPVTITIDANLAALGTNVIGSTSAVFLEGGFDEIRDQLVADAAGKASKSILLSLPTLAQFSVALPAGWTFSGDIFGTKANLKAMGFTGLNEAFGTSDATITFSSAFAFDYDNRDGVTPGTIDFQTVAAHEIGHVLGFDSIVDDVDAAFSLPSASAPIAVLDLFRFASTNLPADASAFTLAQRTVLPGGTQFLSDTVHNFPLSTGLNHGDGWQASHWKNDDITGSFIGIMDPTLAYGVVETPTAADFRALELIGYDMSPSPVPEVGTWTWLVPGLGMLLMHRRRR